MARLSVRLHGEEVSQLELKSGTEYIAGRASDAQIQLADQRGISRHHLKFYERGGSWVCESLSKFVLIQRGSESVQVVELDGPTVFTVPPYEFQFDPENGADSPADEPAAKPSEKLPTFYQPRVGAQQPMGEETSLRVNNEATQAGGSHLIPYMRISHPNTADDEVLKLEGHLWVAGREPSCEIAIDSAHVSRKHFELARTQEGFFVTDLGSSNGTKVNGVKIPPHEPTRIESGDELKIMNITMLFEIRDSQFSNRVQSLPVPAFDPLLGAPSTMPAPWEVPIYDNEPTVMRPRTPEATGWRKHLNWRENKLRVILVVLAPLLLIFALTGKKAETPQAPRDPASMGNSVEFTNLTPEKQSLVKDAFNLARNLYVQGKYALCLTELAKVHELVPQYENSKELDSFCKQGQELVQRQIDMQRKEDQRRQIEQAIAGYVETCKQQLDADATVEETRTCLADAIELDPEHQLITEMLHSAQLHEEERKFMAQQKAETGRKAAKGKALYEQAKATWKEGKLAKAISQYEKFLNAEFPGVHAEKETAKRELASIKKDLKTKIDFLMDQCKTLGGKGRFKEAWEACDKASEEDPRNDEAKSYAEKMHQSLRKDMKNIYEDSVLEESLGNVDSAKEKWQKIVKENLPFDDYTKKAKSKLEKYEGQ